MKRELLILAATTILLAVVVTAPHCAAPDPAPVPASLEAVHRAEGQLEELRRAEAAARAQLEHLRRRRAALLRELDAGADASTADLVDEVRREYGP